MDPAGTGEATEVKTMNPTSNPSQGVRKLTLKDIAPDCPIVINKPLYRLEEITAGKKVVDIGCGFGRFRTVVEGAGGEWIGVEPFEGGAHMVRGDAENLPFQDNTFDIAILHAVLEHVPNPSKAFTEVSRVLKPGGLLIGYVAFMECFHEISYAHLSFKYLEHHAAINGMKLEKVGGGERFGIDYQLAVLFHPLRSKLMERLTASIIRSVFRLKSKMAYLALRYRRKESKEKARDLSELYYKTECLRQSVGFDFIIRKK